jgi:hypothetical protein
MRQLFLRDSLPTLYMTARTQREQATRMLFPRTSARSLFLAHAACRD